MPTFSPLLKVTTVNSVLDFLPESVYKHRNTWEFPDSPVVKDLPASAGDMGLISSPGRFHMPRGNWALAPQLLSPCTAIREVTAMRSPWTTTREESLFTAT